MRALIKQLVNFVSGLQKLNRALCHVFLAAMLLGLPFSGVVAGGGLVLQGDACIIQIEFYSAHFTAYQPSISGNTQICRNLPATGDTIFVLDYLHPSLKEVPVDFRIIRDVTGQGRFVKLKHIGAIESIEQHTLYYQPPVIQADASLKLAVEFLEEGAYVGIVSAGHPSKDTIYTAVFPFEVGGSNYSFWLILIPLLGAVTAFMLRRNASLRRARAQVGT